MTNNLSAQTKIQVANHPVSAGQAAETRREMPWSWRHTGAAVGMIGGFMAGLVGFFLVILQIAETNERAATDLNRLATILLFLTIPMMLFGSFCLDKIEAMDKAIRIERCKSAEKGRGKL
jgi:hypothetical protein